METKNEIRRAFYEALLYTLPILAGFWFVGLGYGLYANASGFPWWVPPVMGAVIFGGSLEFVTVAMLMSPFAPLSTVAVAFLVQARHLFYGLSMLEKYKGMGWKKPFLIFWLCDETFALNYSATIPAGVGRGWFYFFVSFLDYFYWVSGAAVGGLAGSFLLSLMDLRGMDFVMTAMFVVIFIEQLMKEKKHYTAVCGLSVSLAALALFGADRFMLPAMGAILAALLLLRRFIERAGGLG